ncbi:MAG: hypothetical protein U9Q74_04155, partial [Gemmatimonadota bacterium]|nr:hypothetical protein [Gemmatimonadota bacterium]
GEMHRVLKRGGRAVIGLPGPAAPMFETLADSMGRHIEPAAKGFVQRVFSLYAPDALEALLKEAGFKQVDVRSTSHDLSLPAPREFLWQYIGSTPLAGVMQGVGGAARQALEAEVVEAWNASASGDGMALEQPMVYVTASK